MEIEQAIRSIERSLGADIRNGNLDESAFRQHVESLREITVLPGVDDYAAALARAHFTATLVYDRPESEVEAALVRTLEVIEPFHMARLETAAAAYATYPALRTYFERELLVISTQHPDTDERALQSILVVKFARMFAADFR